MIHVFFFFRVLTLCAYGEFVFFRNQIRIVLFSKKKPDRSEVGAILIELTD